MQTAPGHSPCRIFRSALVLGLLLLVSACRTKGGGAAARVSPPWDHLAAGEYLSSEYLDVLSKTRSPLQAGKVDSVLQLIIWRKNGRLLVTPGINFHETDVDFVINPDSSVAPLDPKAGGGSARAAFIDSHTLCFGLGKDAVKKFVFVGDAESAVARAALSGEYKDDWGRTYEFRDDGWAVFPDRNFKFTVGLDHVMSGFDWFSDGTKSWAFLRNGKKIQIFPIAEVDGFDQIVTNSPLLTLEETR